MDFGFRAVISEQVADIFRGNAVTAGLVPVELPADQIRDVMDALTGDPTRAVRIDLVDQRVHVEGTDIDLPLLLAASSRATLRSGTDPVARTLRGAERIEAYERRRPAWMPRIED
jgi:3-isopropylmalate/(R)-2-methylmalate dehydratase small subunit